MSSNESVGRILRVAVLVSLACAVVVSSAVVLLRDAQQANKALDMKRNILAAAGMLEPGRSVEEQFARIEVRAVDLDEGRFTDAVDPATYDQRAAARDPALSRPLSEEEDLAKIKRRERYGLVYLVRGEGGELEKVILPIRGYGLWSTLHGFLALEGDLETVAGLGFYEHGETPGLGGEVDNPLWKAKWPGKKVYDERGELCLGVVKGEVPAGDPRADCLVDGLSGATLTTRGVDHLIKFWLGENGYGRFLANLKRGEA
ncbi:MAG: Na(+)-translocating NADH-quinone reductase subunit C [Porticoccaceae bacterium]|nr:MAG: Na(+)-translocating NADH-quinone reductase subunit C [Porticoccaceae bacterium]